MDEGSGDNPGPSHVTLDLCEAYRDAVHTKIDGVEESLTTKINSIKSIIIVSVSVSTTIISVVMWLLKMQG